MAICGNCGAQSARIRSRWLEGSQLPDECPECAPQSFEKATVPSDKKIWMGYEAHPGEYEKSYDGEGVYYVRKPEYRAEQEQRLQGATAEELALQAAAEEKKRATRRTHQMTEDETLAALSKATLIAHALQDSAE